MEIQFLFLHLINRNIANLSAWFRIDCSTHVVVVNDWDVASMEVESLGSLHSYILIILDLLRWIEVMAELVLGVGRAGNSLELDGWYSVAR